MTAPRRAEDVGDRAQHASGVKAQRAAQRKGGEGSSLAAVKVKPVRSSVNGNAGFRNTLSTTVQGGQGTNPAESVAARGPRRASTVASDDLFATRRPVAGEPSAGSEPGRRSRGSRAGGPLRNSYAGKVNTAGPPRRGAIGITHLHTNYDTACYTPRIVHITCTTHRLKDTRTMHHYTRHRRHKPYDHRHRTPPLGSSLRSALLTARPSHIRHFAPPCRTCAAPAARRGRLPAAGLRPARAQAVRR